MNEQPEGIKVNCGRFEVKTTTTYGGLVLFTVDMDGQPLKNVVGVKVVLEAGCVPEVTIRFQEP